MYAALCEFWGIIRNHTSFVQSTVRVLLAPEIVLFVRVSVLLIVGTVTHSTAITPADTRDIVVSEACHSSTDHTPIACVVLAVIPATGSPVQFVRVPEEGVPRTGVVSVGLVSVLLVRVCVLSVPTSVVVPVGSVLVPATVSTDSSVVITHVELPDGLNLIRFVSSVESVIFTNHVPFGTR